MSEGTRLTTKLNNKWTLKMLLFLVLLAGLGVWAAIDAFWIYPARGRHHVDYTLGAYLECLSKSGRLLSDASVEDPAATLKALEAANAQQSPTCDAFKHAWLVSLSRVSNLGALARENADAIAKAGGTIGVTTTTMFADPQSTLDDLMQRLGKTNSPKPLAAYDIPLQYVFMAVGFGGAVWLGLFLARCKGVSYSYDPAEHRLFMPGGKSFVPSEIAEFDKRDWHKYFVYITLADGSKEMKFDLLRYTPLEEWLLEMEKLHPNYEPPAEEEESGEVEPEGEESEEEPGRSEPS